LFALPIAVVSGDSGSVPAGKFRLEVGRDIAASNDTVVIRMTVKVNASSHELPTHLQWYGMNQPGNNSWSGGPTEFLHKELLFVAQWMSACPSHEMPLLVYTVEHGKAPLHRGISRAPGTKSLQDVFRLTAHSGAYPLETPLVVGELNGTPIILTVGSSTE